MNSLLFFRHRLLAILAFAMVLTSCVDQDFDLPPAPEIDPAFKNTITITELVNRFYKAGQITKITDTVSLSALVIGNDESGNLFKELVIQDATGGIRVQLNVTGLYNDYPVGKRVFVNCAGLYVGDFAGTLQLGGSIDASNNRLNRIDEGLLKKHIAKGPQEDGVKPKIVGIDQLTSADINTLIQLENVQFSSNDVGKNYADAINRFAVNLNVEDCTGKTIILRTSGFADFATQTAKDGNGTITAIYNVFNTTPQLVIRDLSDIKFSSARCQKGGGTGEENLISIAAVRALFSGATTSAPDKSKIKGIVISDRTAGSTTGRNLVIQEPNGKGIVVRFTNNHSFNLGQELEIVISKAEISEFNGLLQLNNLELGSAKVLSSGNVIQPKILSINEILGDFENIESTLVRIDKANIVGNNTYGGATTVRDRTGEITMFTASTATFANQPVERAEVSITAIVSQGGNQQARQIAIRNLSDIVKTSDGGGNTGSPLLEVTFEDQQDFENVALRGWQNVSLKGEGTRKWLARAFGGNLFAQATAFRDEKPEMDTWLISPELNLTQVKTLEFESATAFWTHNGLSVLFSENYDGTNVQAATWTKIEAKIAGQNDPNYNWIPSGVINLPNGTKGYIAFRCEGNNTTNTTTYRLDNIKLK